LSDETVAGVAMGTAATEAERRLQASLGRPTYADDEPGCNGEKGRQLIWGEGELVVYMLAEGGAGAALSGWSASRTQRFDYRFPYGTRLGESAAAIERRVPGATGRAMTEGDYAESYVVETPNRPGLVWRAKGASARAPIFEVAYNPVGCD
jgi:hypothetical protein